MKLVDALNTLPLDALKVIAQRHHLSFPSNVYRRDLLLMLAKHMERRDVVDAALASLSAPARQALDALTLKDGYMIAQVFAQDYGAIPSNYDPYGYGGIRPSERESSAAHELWLSGFIYQAYGRIGNWQGEVCFIPEEIQAILPKPRMTAFADLLVAAPEPAGMSPQPALVRDIGLLLCYLQRETVRAVRGDQLAKRDLLKLNEDLSLRQDLAAVRQESEATWISFVHLLARLMGLVRVSSGLLTPSDDALDWLKQGYEKQLWDAWRRFHKDGSWNDLERALPPSAVYVRPGPQYTVAVRNGLLSDLKRCPVSLWLTSAGLDHAMKVHSPLFMRSQAEDSAWPSWTRDYFHGGWDMVEGAFIRYLLAGPLNWFGIVQVSAGNEVRPPALFRLTRQGEILLGIAKAPIALPEERTIVVQPTFEIIVPPEAPPAVLFELQQIAELGKRDRASVYTLSQSAVWRYLHGSGRIDDIITFLEQASQRPLPQNVAYSLREWAARFGELRLEQATLLLANSEALLAEVRANRCARRATGQRPGLALSTPRVTQRHHRQPPISESTISFTSSPQPSCSEALRTKVDGIPLSPSPCSAA
jgi:hypothetical protein